MMNSTLKTALFAIGAAFTFGCGASPGPAPMRPAAGTLPETDREVNVTVEHGDKAIVIDEALIVSDRQGRRFLMLFDGDVSCEDTVDPGIVPRGLVLQAELDASGQPNSWTFYRNGTIVPLEIGSSEAEYRSGAGGGSLALTTVVDQLALKVRGSYQPEYCS
jgi:hypothetical protein